MILHRGHGYSLPIRRSLIVLRCHLQKSGHIAITIPQNLVNHDSSIERTYRIVRIHDGVATLIDGNYDAATNQFTFATDGFSTYALVYEDVNTTLTGRSPKTGDNSLWMVWTLILCAGCSILFAAGKRYKKREC